MKLKAIIDILEQGLIERGQCVRLCLLAALAGEHSLLIGPPGTAKSELARRLHAVFRDARYFERLLTRFSVPEELFGPLSIKALEEDRYERHTDGFLPDASIAFIDEVFKANSAILNALLTLLNEREFDNGAGRQRCPLISAIGATNEVPEDEVGEAFFDRFLVRLPVAAVSGDNFGALLDAGRGREWQAPGAELCLDAGDLARLAGDAAAVSVPEEFVAVLAELRRHFGELPIQVSDRRWVKIVWLLRVAAASEGRPSVTLWDLLLLPWLTAPDAPRQAAVADWLAARLGVREAFSPARLTRVVEAFEAQLEAETNANDLDYDESGRLKFSAMESAAQLADQVGDAKGGAAAPRMSYSRRRRYGASHIAARVCQIDALLERIAGYAAEIAARRRDLAAFAGHSLWLNQGLTARAGIILASTAAAIDELAARARRPRRLPRITATGAGQRADPRTGGSRSPRRGVSPPPLLPAPLLFERDEGRLAPLDGLARSLWLGGMTNSQGRLEPRLDALAGLRDELLAGRETRPEAWSWPPPPVALALHEAIARLGLARYCSGEQELTNTVLMSILFELDFIVDYVDRGASEEQALQMAIAAFVADWQEHCGQIDELVEVFGLVPDDCRHASWDQMRRLLHSSGWQEVLRIRRLLERLQELAGIIRGLGRSRQSEQDDAASQSVVEVMEQAVALRAESRTVRVPDMPGETRGIHRSDRIARMLPAESMLLGHPRLRLVWHARRAERTLLCYEDDDRMTEVRLHQSPVMQPRPGVKVAKRLELGPILVCVDTSGSMQGGAEAVAKAVVLEAMRSAHAQRRPCHLFAFGGPEELVEMELGVDSAGIARVTEFLGQAFRGGTDICGPLERVIAKLEEQRWRQADLLLATDGEFGATPELATRLAAVKRDLGLRVQGVLVADRETLGLLEIADSIYPVRDWRRYGGANVDSPVHSHRLTAMYFPGALRSAENQAATVAGEAASAVVIEGRHRGESDDKARDGQ